MKDEMAQALKDMERINSEVGSRKQTAEEQERARTNQSNRTQQFQVFDEADEGSRILNEQQLDDEILDDVKKEEEDE